MNILVVSSKYQSKIGWQKDKFTLSDISDFDEALNIQAIAWRFLDDAVGWQVNTLDDINARRMGKLMQGKPRTKIRMPN
ncbi:MAG: hypothetical protein KME23_21080 [Goleter apudmare HA4340-LM2]|nr:hypothetical protein [Goleter apudmare HA4340-LM2]